MSQKPGLHRRRGTQHAQAAAGAARAPLGPRCVLRTGRGEQRGLEHHEPRPCLRGHECVWGVLRGPEHPQPPQVPWSPHRARDGEAGAVLSPQVQGLCFEGAGWKLRADPQRGTRGLWELPACPGSPSPAFCGTLAGFGAGTAAEEALPGGSCVPAPSCQPGARLPPSADANGSRQPGWSGKDQTPAARGCCQRGRGARSHPGGG